MRLIDKIGGLKKAELKTAYVDVSHVFEEEPGTTQFAFVQPSVQEMFRVNNKSEWLKLQFPEWPDALCDTVGIMLVMIDKSGYNEDDTANADLAFAHFIDRISLDEYGRFSRQLFEAFPEMKEPKKAVEDAKKN